jgi:hypothetical protein
VAGEGAPDAFRLQAVGDVTLVGALCEAVIENVADIVAGREERLE